MFLEGSEDPHSTIDGQSSTHQRNAIYMAFSWRTDDGWLGNFVIFQGILTCIGKKTYIFVIFSGGGGGQISLLRPLDPRMAVQFDIVIITVVNR